LSVVLVSGQDNNQPSYTLGGMNVPQSIPSNLLPFQHGVTYRIRCTLGTNNWDELYFTASDTSCPGGLSAYTSVTVAAVKASLQETYVVNGNQVAIANERTGGSQTNFGTMSTTGYGFQAKLAWTMDIPSSCLTNVYYNWTNIISDSAARGLYVWTGVDKGTRVSAKKRNPPPSPQISERQYSYSSYYEPGYLGCWDDEMVSDLNFFASYLPSDQSLLSCRGLCKQLEYSYAGLHSGGTCWCGNTAPSGDGLLDDSRCNIHCPFDPYHTDYCGGQGEFSVWDTNVITNSFLIYYYHLITGANALLGSSSQSAIAHGFA